MGEPVVLPLISTATNRERSFLKDARLINCLLEKDGLGKIWVYKRPGYNTLYARTNGTARGQYNWANSLYSVSGTTLYKDNTGIGAVSSSGDGSGHYDFSELVNGATLLLKSTTNAYTTDGATITAMADADYPATTVPGVAYLDGTTYVMDAQARIHGSDLNTHTAWDPLNVIVAQSAPGDGVALAKHLVYVVAFKQWSTEFFYDAGNPSGSPLSRYEGPLLQVGCAAPFSVQVFGGMVFWVGQTRAGGFSVQMLDKLSGSEVSTPAICRLLRSAYVASITSASLDIDGRKFYILHATDGTIEYTLVFDIREKLWYQWSDTNGSKWPIREIALKTGVGGTKMIVGQHFTNGDTVEIDAGYYTDQLALFDADVYTGNFDGGTRTGKFLNRLDVLGDAVVGSRLQIRHNDEDYKDGAWSNFREVDLGQVKPYLDNCGTFVRRAWHTHHRQNLPMRLEAFQLDIWPGVL